MCDQSIDYDISSCPDEDDNSPVNITPPIGPTADGAYMTPHRVTIFYRTYSIFETAVAALSSRSQLVPIDDPGAVDYSVAAAIGEHPTPEILIFGGAFSRADILKFFNRHADMVHVFTYTKAESSQYYDTDENGKTTAFDPRVVCFGPEDLHQHALIVSNAAAIYLLEHIMCATFPSYKSTIVAEWAITAITGRCLVDALKFKYGRSSRADSGAIGIAVLELCAGVDAFEKIDRLVMTGQLLHEHREVVTSDCLASGILFARDGLKYWGVNARPTHIRHFIDLALVHPLVVKSGADIVLLYSAEHHTIETDGAQGGPVIDLKSPISTKSIVFPGWRVFIIAAQTQSVVDLRAVLSGAQDSVDKGKSTLTMGGIHEGPGMVSAWVPNIHAAGLLPFIYTQNISPTDSLGPTKDTQDPQ